MEKEMKIYHVETQEDYDDLMIKLEQEGYKWEDGDRPTSHNFWGWFKRKTIIVINETIENTLTYGSLDRAGKKYTYTTIIKHKAGDTLELEGKLKQDIEKAVWYLERAVSKL